MIVVISNYPCSGAMEAQRIEYFATAVDTDTLGCSCYYGYGYDLDRLKDIAFNLGIECRYYAVTKPELTSLIDVWYSDHYFDVQRAKNSVRR